MENKKNIMWLGVLTLFSTSIILSSDGRRSRDMVAQNTPHNQGAATSAGREIPAKVLASNDFNDWDDWAAEQKRAEQKRNAKAALAQQNGYWRAVASSSVQRLTAVAFYSCFQPLWDRLTAVVAQGTRNQSPARDDVRATPANSQDSDEFNDRLDAATNAGRKIPAEVLASNDFNVWYDWAKQKRNARTATEAAGVAKPRSRG